MRNLVWLLVAFFCPPLLAQPLGSWEHWLNSCQESRIVYLGESHDCALDHQIQRKTLEALHSGGRKVIVLAEMFQLPSRQILEQYCRGELDDDQLRERSEWNRRWGHDWELYLPIWQFCRKQSLHLRPLRNSSETNKNLGKLGVEAFTEEEKQGLAPEPHTFGPHPESLRAIFEAHAGPVSDESFSRFLRVQTLWEEFMAARIRQAMVEDPRAQILVLVGKGHLLHGHGLQGRVADAWPEPVSQCVALVNPGPEEKVRCQAWLSLEAAQEATK